MTQVHKLQSEWPAVLEGWSQALAPEGLRAYAALAAAPDWLDETAITAAVADPRLNLKRGLVALCYHGLILHDGAWSRYRPIGTLWHTWFTHNQARLLASADASAPPPVVHPVPTEEPASTDQRGQHVGIQLNIVGDVHAGPPPTPVMLLATLKQLLAAVNAAAVTGQLAQETADNAAYHIQQALHHARRPSVSSAQMVAHLQTAQAAIPPTADDLMCDVDQAIHMVQQL